MRLYSVSEMSIRMGEVDFNRPITVWVKTQKEAKAVKAEWLAKTPKADIKVMQREVPTTKDELCRWLNHHVTGRPNV